MKFTKIDNYIKYDDPKKQKQVENTKQKEMDSSRNSTIVTTTTTNQSNQSNQQQKQWRFWKPGQFWKHKRLLLFRVISGLINKLTMGSTSTNKLICYWFMRYNHLNSICIGTSILNLHKNWKNYCYKMLEKINSSNKEWNNLFWTWENSDILGCLLRPVFQRWFDEKDNMRSTFFFTWYAGTTANTYHWFWFSDDTFLEMVCVEDEIVVTFFFRSQIFFSAFPSNLISFYVVEVGFTKTKKFGFFRYYAINLTEMQDVNVTTQQISVDTVSVTVYNYYNSLVGPHNVYFFVSEASGTETSLDDLSPQQITIYQDTSGKISERNLIAWKCWKKNDYDWNESCVRYWWCQSLCWTLPFVEWRPCQDSWPNCRVANYPYSEKGSHNNRHQQQSGFIFTNQMLEEGFYLHSKTNANFWDAQEVSQKLINQV